MATISTLLGAGSVGTSVYTLTKSTEDAASAAGYAAWVESLTGSSPVVVDLGGGRAQVVLTEEQARLMRNWLEMKMQSVILPKRGEPSTLEIEFGPVVKPIVLKYIAVFSALMFFTGWISRGMVK